jgi:hypothetical protein
MQILTADSDCMQKTALGYYLQRYQAQFSAEQQQQKKSHRKNGPFFKQKLLLLLILRRQK